jgi:hypothetical protein
VAPPDCGWWRDVLTWPSEKLERKGELMNMCVSSDEVACAGMS